jgi:hypothetical protein
MYLLGILDERLLRPVGLMRRKDGDDEYSRRDCERTTSTTSSSSNINMGIDIVVGSMSIVQQNENTTMKEIIIRYIICLRKSISDLTISRIECETTQLLKYPYTKKMFQRGETHVSKIPTIQID